MIIHATKNKNNYQGVSKHARDVASASKNPVSLPAVRDYSGMHITRRPIKISGLPLEN